MKKLFTLLLSILIFSSIVTAQQGFVIDITGSFDNIDLPTATKTNIGTIPSNITASDFGPGGLLFAINSVTNEFYSIDTITGVSTVLGTNPPPTDQTWTGMAYEEATGIMYGYSYNIIDGVEGTLYTIDVSDGSYSIVGINYYLSRISAIAIDDNGQMYGLMRGDAFSRIVLISAGGGIASYLPTMNNSPSMGFGLGHGLDYNIENQTGGLVDFTRNSYF